MAVKKRMKNKVEEISQNIEQKDKVIKIKETGKKKTLEDQIGRRGNKKYAYVWYKWGGGVVKQLP